MIKFSFLYHKKKISIDARECRSFLSQGTGLMFRKKSSPLLFIFSRKNRDPIHSFFCVPFVAIWFDDDKIVDLKYVSPWKISIRPQKNANKLLEIPINDFNFKKFERKK
jgi:uncharacterized membrane protein (UPF0127 family)